METFETVKAFHDRLLQLASALRFNKHDSVDLHRVALYGTMLELTGCMIHLIEHNGRTGRRYSAPFWKPLLSFEI